jgi:hypothetical protein
VASESLVELLRLGPFVGMDLTTAELYVKPDMAVESLNVNTTISTGALCAERGRTQLFDVTGHSFGGSSLDSIVNVTPAMGSFNHPGALFQGPPGSPTLTGYYDYYSNTITTVTNGLPYTQAVQFGQVIYTNGGQRFFVTADNTKLYQWQYPAFQYVTPALTTPPPSRAPTPTGSVTVDILRAQDLLYFHGSITVGDQLRTIVDGNTIITNVDSPNPLGQDDSAGFDVLAAHIVYDINRYYQDPANPGYTMTNKVFASIQPFLTPGTSQIIITSIFEGVTGNSRTLSVTSSAGATEGYTTNEPTLMQGFAFTGSTGFITPGTYFYVFTRITTMPDGSTSETSVYPDDFASPLVVNVTYGQNNITGFRCPNFSGTNSDGTTFTTNVYRESSNQAGFFFVGNAPSSSLEFIDTFSDLQIQGNAQLIEHRDQPPVINANGSSNQGFLAVHAGRLWVFVVEDGPVTGTPPQPQTQLWYSTYARPWEFDAVNQVLLLDAGVVVHPENSSGQPTPVYGNPVGNLPAGLCEVGTELIALKLRETWSIWGDGSTGNPFSAKVIFPYGCMAPLSVLGVTGMMFWFNESGDLMMFDGSAPQNISEQIRGAIRFSSVNTGLTSFDLVNACLSYSGQILYLSFPTKGFTYSYSVPGKQWLSKLPYSPYSAQGVATTVSNPFYPAGTNQNEVLAVRKDHPTSVDQWFTNPNGDLSNTYQTFSWKSTHTDSGKPEWRKWYQFVRVTAPKQFGTVNIVLTMDNGDDPQETFSVSLDLDGTQASKTGKFLGNQGKAVGFLAQVTVTVMSTPGQPAPIIWAIQLFGGLNDRPMHVPT